MPESALAPAKKRQGRGASSDGASVALVPAIRERRSGEVAMAEIQGGEGGELESRGSEAWLAALVRLRRGVWRRR